MISIVGTSIKLLSRLEWCFISLCHAYFQPFRFKPEYMSILSQCEHLVDKGNSPSLASYGQVAAIENSNEYHCSAEIQMHSHLSEHSILWLQSLYSRPSGCQSDFLWNNIDARICGHLLQRTPLSCTDGYNNIYLIDIS